MKIETEAQVPTREIFHSLNYEVKQELSYIADNSVYDTSQDNNIDASNSYIKTELDTTVESEDYSYNQLKIDESAEDDDEEEEVPLVSHFYIIFNDSVSLHSYSI